jgi:predicted AAA+ superfamily ATPase
MSLVETGHSTGAVSLAALLQGERPHSPEAPLMVADLAQRIAVGGWPGLLRHDTSRALQSVRDYLDEVRRVDIVRVDGTQRDPDKVGRLLRALARNVATYVASTTLAADTGGPEGPLARDTVSDYLTALERLMVIEDQPAWATHIRSKSILRSSSKRHFVDPSLAVAALRGSPDRLLADLNAMGFLFESLVVRDLRVYAQANDASVLQYRDNTGLEVDAIVEAADGRWMAVEVKLGGSLVDEGAATLLKFRDRIDTTKCGPPAALAVVVATGYAYQREDGIGVIPIGCFGP